MSKKNKFYLVILFSIVFTQILLLGRIFGNRNNDEGLESHEVLASKDKINQNNTLHFFNDLKVSDLSVRVVIRIPDNCCNSCVHNEIMFIKDLNLYNSFILGVDIESDREILFFKKRFHINNDILVLKLPYRSFNLDIGAKPFYIVYKNNRIIDIFSSVIDNEKKRHLLDIYTKSSDH